MSNLPWQAPQPKQAQSLRQKAGQLFRRPFSRFRRRRRGKPEQTAEDKRALAQYKAHTDTVQAGINARLLRQVQQQQAQVYQQRMLASPGYARPPGGGDGGGGGGGGGGGAGGGGGGVGAAAVSPVLLQRAQAAGRVPASARSAAATPFSPGGAAQRYDHQYYQQQQQQHTAAVDPAFEQAQSEMHRRHMEVRFEEDQRSAQVSYSFADCVRKDRQQLLQKNDDGWAGGGRGMHQQYRDHLHHRWPQQQQQQQQQRRRQQFPAPTGLVCVYLCVCFWFLPFFLFLFCQSMVCLI